MCRKISAFILIIIFLCIGLPGQANSQGKFPSNKNLEDRNISLKMSGFIFASGLRTDERGKMNCNGIELLANEWAGSGFVVKDDGTVVTNYHVARKALRGEAILIDGSRYDIEHIKVYHSYDDLAILKIRSQRRFPTVNLGDSENIAPRDKVLAIGNPLHMGLNMTEGMVSQVVKDDHNRVDMIVHTAQIAPGNSGGALYRGDKVIGVNVAMRLIPNLGASGFNMAIPINKVKNLMNPQYNKIVRFEDAFPVDPTLIVQKAQLIAANNGQVPAASGNNPGMTSYRVSFNSLEDMVILLESPGRDLALVATDGQQMIGCGDLPEEGFEALFMSSDHPKDIEIRVVNFDSKPANFGLKISSIRW
jgi:hypothetical protein